METATQLREKPDSLLIRILSYLDVENAGLTTSVLSKRWQRICSKLPKLEFGASWLDKDAPNFVQSSVNRTESYDSNLDDWVEFCVKNNVKILLLKFSAPRDEYYTVPQVMYSSSSLTTLHLIGCINMDYEGAIEWNSLTDLALINVELNQHTLDQILSTCPVLKNLVLTSCRGFNRLKVNSEYLNSLTVEESEDEPFVEISAPYIRSFDIARGRTPLQLINISGVVKASIDLFELDGDNSVDMTENVKDFLQNFKHVNDLYVRHLCFQVVSKMALNGWQLPQFRVQHLKIDASTESQLSIAGIICLLESSISNVETLFLNVFQTKVVEISDMHHPAAAKGDLDGGDLLHLKKITFNKCVDPHGEPLLTLASILLRRAPALEDMVIVVYDCLQTSDYINLCRALLTYPRSSSNARIHISRR